jgi:hypothetical protein
MYLNLFTLRTKYPEDLHPFRATDEGYDYVKGTEGDSDLRTMTSGVDAVVVAWGAMDDLCKDYPHQVERRVTEALSVLQGDLNCVTVQDCGLQ